MTEHELSRRIVTFIRAELGPNAVVYKLNDRVTKGIPDIAVTRGGRTTWLEIKLFSCAEPSESELKKKLDKAQRHEVTRLRRAGRAFYVTGYHEEGRVRLAVVAPENVDRFGAYRFGRGSALNDDLRMLLTFL